MASLRRTGTILVFALIPWLIAGCAGTGSRLANWRRPSADSQEQTWSNAQRLEKEGRLAEARQLYVKLYLTDTESVRYAHRLGVVSTLLGEHDKAAAAYQRARELDPQNPEVLADAGYAASLQKNYQEAEQLLQASLAIADNNPRAKSNLALVVGIQGRDDECEALFREVHGQDEVEILCNLAYVRSQRGDFEDAAGLYQQALAIDPAAKKATVALAQLKTDERAATIAQQKPYRKYMQGNSSAVAESKPKAKNAVSHAAGAGDSETTPGDDVALASQTRDESLTSASESLTDWTEAEGAAEASTDDVVRGFPQDGGLEQATSDSVSANAPATLQTVTSDDSPFSVVETPETTEAQGSATSDLDEPAEFPDAWADASAGPDRFSAEAQADRSAQIAARSGLSGHMGFCPVALRDEIRLVDVQPQFTTEHQSQTYQFSSEAAKKKFEADPERYLPAAGGLDVVAVSQGTAVAQGSLEHALWFRHKLYLFLNAENRELFRQQARQFAVQQ